jgi:hypothetical protein
LTDDARTFKNQLKHAIDNLPAQNLAQVLAGADGDRADELAFMHAQESVMRRFWKETENDDL